MLAAQAVTAEGPEEEWVRRFDLRQIDNPDRRDFWYLKYQKHLRLVTRLVRRYVPRGGTILDIACAQGNLSLLLAEQGYHCTACDLREGYLTYSRKKHTSGNVRWVCQDAFALGAGDYDCVLMCEFIEHVAHPGEIVARALGMVRPGGVLIVTTPNGARVNRDAPSYTEASRDVAAMEAKQFGPGGGDHVFEATPEEFRAILSCRREALVEFRTYCSPLYCNATQRLLRVPLVGLAAEGAIDLLAHGRWTGRRLGDRMLAVVRRPA